MQYTTQMDAARKGIITKEMESAAKKEQMDVRELMTLMAQRPGHHSLQQKTHLSGAKRHWFHAQNEDQCKSGHFQGLQRHGHGN